MDEGLLLLFDAPAVSFGADVIDNIGVVRDFPALSMVAGLLGNALGYDRGEADLLDLLQARLVLASGLMRPSLRCRDYQTARLFQKDAGWTTRGAPEGRAASPSFDWDEDWQRDRGEARKSLTHQRYRDFDADALVLVALSLAEGPGPSPSDIAAALERPERPLFIGRKPFLPARPILFDRGDGADVIAALARGARRLDVRSAPVSAPANLMPGVGEVVTAAGYRLQTHRRARIADIRQHRAGVHGGTRPVALGMLVLPEGDDP